MVTTSQHDRILRQAPESQQEVNRRSAGAVHVSTLLALMSLWFLTLGVYRDAEAASLPPAIEALRPIKGICYDPTPSDDPLGAASKPNSPAAHRFFVYQDSDFFNADFPALWDDANGGRGDLKLFKDSGFNFLHIYNWNPNRNHTPFLDKANSLGLKVMIPISNFTASLTDASCCGINPNNAGFNPAFQNIKAIFDNIYQGGTTPHPAAALWDIMNEFDFEAQGADKVVFIIQSILKLEQDASIPAANRLPIAVVVSFAVRDKASYDNDRQPQPPIFAQAESAYRAIHPTGPIPGGVLSLLAASLALQQAPTSYKGPKDKTPVIVPAVPSDFWQTRFVAVVNPFEAGPTVNKFLTDTNSGFQSAFPGTTSFNSLPPLFLGEFGQNRSESSNEIQQAAFVLTQMKCTNAFALHGDLLPGGYFLGSNAFEYSPVCKNKYWNIFGFTGNGSTADPFQGPLCEELGTKLNDTCTDPIGTQCQGATPQPSTFTMQKTTTGPLYRQDKLIPFAEWQSFITGFQQSTIDCGP
jgi:hypothetical protein